LESATGRLSYQLNHIVIHNLNEKGCSSKVSVYPPNHGNGSYPRVVIASLTETLLQYLRGVDPVFIK